MVEVDELDEGLDLAAQRDLLLRHGLGDLLGRAGQSGNQRVAVRARLLAVERDFSNTTKQSRTESEKNCEANKTQATEHVSDNSKTGSGC